MKETPLGEDPRPDPMEKNRGPNATRCGSENVHALHYNGRPLQSRAKRASGHKGVDTIVEGFSVRRRDPDSEQVKDWR